MMRRRFVLSASVVLASALVAAQSRELQPAGDQPTFRVGTRLATIDAVVVDSKGQHVTDLTPADFEVVERGKTQTVRQVVYVRNVPGGTAPAPAPVAAPAAAADPAVPGVTPATAPRARPLAGGVGLSTPERTGRVLAIVVDDLGLSFESTASVRRMLTQYVDTKVRPGDLVAIIRTAGGVGALQQFTTDRRLLHAAIDRVRWSLQSRNGVAAFEAVTPDASTSLFSQRSQQIGEPPPLLQSPDAFREEVSAAGTLGALEYIVRGIEALPGRKSVIFVSDGFDLGIKNAKASRTWSAFTRMMDRANRAGVVVYTIDGRGLQTAGLTAEDDPQTPKMNMFGGPGGGGAPTGPQLSAKVTGSANERMTDLIDTQEALVYLAQQTGGLAMLNTNDLSGALDRIVDDTQGYYLIGFDTAITPDQRWDPNDVRVRVKREGLSARARRGLFGPAEKDRPKDDVLEDPLVTAALSPFSTGAIDVRLTTLFAHDKKAGSYVRSLFFIDPAGLTFSDGPDGRKDADLTLLLMAIGDNGQAIAQLRRQLDLRLTADEYQQLRQRGLLYSARLVIQEPGGYQIRAAVRDRNSEAVGTGAQFVEVPKVGKNQVALSGVVMMDVTAGSGTPTGLSTDALADGVLGEPAIKIFRPGSEVAYTCEIYDGRGKREEGFATSATLLRDGKPVYTTPPSAVSGADREAKPVGAVPVGGKLSLGRGLPRGSYTLQVSVSPRTDKPKAKAPSATQWVDFEVR